LKTNILYVSWDGIIEPLGQSQVLSYLKKLSSNYCFHLVSLEKKKDFKRNKDYENIVNICASSDIRWVKIIYTSNVIFSNLWNLTKCFIKSFRILISNDIKCIHARSYPPALIGLLLKKFFGVKLIFDMRGFWIDEKVDSNRWLKNSVYYKIGKKLEKILINNSDFIISLTFAGKQELEKNFNCKNKNIPIEVIRTCADLDKFNIKSIRQDKSSLILGYVGTATGWYMFDEVLIFYKYLKEKKPGSNLRIINMNEHVFIKNKLHKHNISLKDIYLGNSSFDNIPIEMKKIDFGIFFIKPSYAKKASCATKLGEFLASGVPCITNMGVGDHSEIIKKNNTGIILEKFDHSNYDKTIKLIEEFNSDYKLKERCLITANDFFSLEKGVLSYSKIYSTIFK
tara:strand:- start:9975 stop:11165 length:1191 start_codon:yes stop_codon:yes gene_type:complete